MTPRPTTQNPATILIVDDHPLVRLGIRQLIERDSTLVVAGEAESVQEALGHIEKDRPDLVTVDIALPGANGIELIKQIRCRWPKVKMLASSMHEEKTFAHRALQAGAQGYIEKRRAIREITIAIHAVLEGRIYLSPEMTDRVLRQASGSAPEDMATDLDRLSDRELEVFDLMGQGLTTREIAERLMLSPKTIESHRDNIKTKLGVGTLNELMRRAVEWSLRQE